LSISVYGIFVRQWKSGTISAIEPSRHKRRIKPNQTKMKSSNQDKAEGSAKDLKGKVKESVGKATGDKSLQARGNADQAAGKIQKKTGDVKKVFGK